MAEMTQDLVENVFVAAILKLSLCLVLMRNFKTTCESQWVLSNHSMNGCFTIWTANNNCDDSR